MIYRHFSEAPWDDNRWPNFTPKELSCPCCGELFWSPSEFDIIQQVRTMVDRPIRLNSTHRCPVHSAHVGGAPLSEHKRLAFDISTNGQDRTNLLQACIESGFSSFGFYAAFLHADTRPGRRWYSPSNPKSAREIWSDAISTLS